MPDRLMQNGYVESFNDRVHDELFNETLFLSPAHARAVVRVWADDDSTERPHSSVGYVTQAAFAAGASGALVHHNNRRSLAPAG